MTVRVNPMKNTPTMYLWNDQNYWTSFEKSADLEFQRLRTLNYDCLHEYGQNFQDPMEILEQKRRIDEAAE